MTTSRARIEQPAQTVDPLGQPRVQIAWLELTCLPCGAVAGYIENGRIVRANYPGGIRLVRTTLRCGRCDGMLLPGDRGVATAPGQIG